MKENNAVVMVGVSNWRLVFNDGSEFCLNAVKKEDVKVTSTCYSYTKYRVKITHATLSTDLLEKYKSGIKLKEVYQTTLCQDPKTSKLINYEMIVPHKTKIESFSVKNYKDSCGLVEILIAENKEEDSKNNGLGMQSSKENTKIFVIKKPHDKLFEYFSQNFTIVQTEYNSKEDMLFLEVERATNNDENIEDKVKEWETIIEGQIRIMESLSNSFSKLSNMLRDESDLHNVAQQMSRESNSTYKETRAVLDSIMNAFKIIK